jgi:pimeloyl-ACP methyl ester carboxylesterase
MVGSPFPSIAFLWPALLAASVSDAASTMAGEFAHLAATAEEAEPPVVPPRWASANEIALELPTMRLRDFSAGATGAPTLVCAPFALHGASVADFAPGHSLVATLRASGRGRLFVTDWRSASPEARFYSIDTYLADLNFAVDAVGEKVDLIGLCQGGWMALAFAARFPNKVRRLVLAGAPVDIAAGPSLLSRLTDSLPMATFREMVQAGEGRVLGRRVLGLWGPVRLGADVIAEILQVPPERLAARAAPAGAVRGVARLHGRPARHLLSASGRVALQTKPARHRALRRARPSTRSRRVARADLSHRRARRRAGRARAGVRHRAARRHAARVGAHRNRPVPPPRPVHGRRGIAHGVAGNCRVDGSGFVGKRCGGRSRRTSCGVLSALRAPLFTVDPDQCR